MKELVQHLERIAKANGEKFRYIILIEPRMRKKQVELYLTFIVEEDEESHTFLCLMVEDLNLEKFNVSEFVLKEACLSWNHKYVD